MTRPIKITLLAIGVALAFMIGSFVWFVVTWDAEAEESLTRNDAPLLHRSSNIPGSGAEPQSAPRHKTGART